MKDASGDRYVLVNAVHRRLKLAEVGKIFRLIQSVSWASEELEPAGFEDKWVNRLLERMSRYARRIREVAEQPLDQG